MRPENSTTTSGAVRNLIICDTQFGMTGSTTLRLQELLDLQSRGWLIEGEEHNEFDLTDEGRAVVERALKNAVPATLSTVKPGGTVQLAGQSSFPVVEMLDIRNQLHVMATTVVPNFCDLAAGLQGKVQQLIDDHRRAHPGERS